VVSMCPPRFEVRTRSVDTLQRQSNVQDRIVFHHSGTFIDGSLAHYQIRTAMSALGQKRTCAVQPGISAMGSGHSAETNRSPTSPREIWAYGGKPALCNLDLSLASNPNSFSPVSMLVRRQIRLLGLTLRRSTVQRPLIERP
jgi:hypothetical protein